MFLSGEIHIKKLMQQNRNLSDYSGHTAYGNFKRKKTGFEDDFWHLQVNNGFRDGLHHKLIF
jgi:hypothetical protein